MKTRWIKKMMHDYDLVVTGGSTGLSMQFSGGFMEQYGRTYVPACRAVLEQAFQTTDFIAEPDRRYGVRLNETLEYRGCKGILDYDRETRNRAQRDKRTVRCLQIEKNGRGYASPVPLRFDCVKCSYLISANIISSAAAAASSSSSTSHTWASRSRCASPTPVMPKMRYAFSAPKSTPCGMATPMHRYSA